MKIINLFLLLIAFLVVACSGNLPEPTTTISSVPFSTVTPLATTTLQLSPTATGLAAKTEECRESGHTSRWFDEPWLTAYFGTMGENNESIGMTLIYSGNNVEGRFFHNEQPTELRVEGCLENGRDFVLNIHDRDNAVLAAIHGQFPKTDPKGGYEGIELERDVIIGTLENKLTNENSSIYLRLEHAIEGTLDHHYQLAGVKDDQFIDQAAQKLLSAIANDNKEFVAEMMEYPVWVTLGDQNMEFANTDEFLKNYEKVFTDEFKAILANARPHHMYANGSGIRLGNGEILFNANGKVFVITNTSG